MDEPRPFFEGYHAGIRGDDPRTCPYEKLSAEWKEWQTWHGWGAQVAAATEALRGNA